MGSINWNTHEEDKLDKQLVERLHLVAARLPFPVTVTSSYRATDPRTHGQYCGIDFKPDVENLYNKLGHMKGWYNWQLLYKGNTDCDCPKAFSRIGVYNKHWHLDTGNLAIDSKRFPAEVLWIGVSR